MDMSLDDYMQRGGNFGRGRGGAGRGRGRGRFDHSRLSGKAVERANDVPVRSGGVGEKSSIKSRLGSGGAIRRRSDEGSGGGAIRRRSNEKARIQTKALAMDMEEIKSSSSGNLKIMVGDARAKIGANKNVDIQDARSRIGANKTPPIADARLKIKAKVDSVKVDTVRVNRRKLKKGDTDDDDDPPLRMTIGNNKAKKPLQQNFKVKTIDNDPPRMTIRNTVSDPPMRDFKVKTMNEHYEQDLTFKRTVNQDVPPPQNAPRIARPFDADTDLTVVRNFRPSLATFTMDDDNHSNNSAGGLEVRFTRKIAPAEPVYTLPDYSDLLRDTERKLQAGQGDLYYGKMQADQEAGALYTKVLKVQSQRTLPVESPIITIDNEKAKTKSDPAGIIAMPRLKKAAPATSRVTSSRSDRHEPMETETSPGVEMVSPLQGFKVTVTNLHPAVTQEDIIELFASLGALKKARLLKKGNAEVVYVKKEDALSAVKRYHNRLLDNVPMVVKCVAPAALMKAPTNTFSLSSSSKSKEPKEAMDLDIEVVHKALFKNSKEQSTAQPVQFLVKI